MVKTSILLDIIIFMYHKPKDYVRGSTQAMPENIGLGENGKRTSLLQITSVRSFNWNFSGTAAPNVVKRPGAYLKTERLKGDSLKEALALPKNIGLERSTSDKHPGLEPTLE